MSFLGRLVSWGTEPVGQVQSWLGVVWVKLTFSNWLALDAKKTGPVLLFDFTGMKK